jgi:hypothetical protein
MRDIALDEKPTALPRHTFLVYGDTRTGKTVFGATLPRPLIIADVTEGGYQSIRNMDRSQWFEPDVEPIIKGVENMNDLAQLSPVIDDLVARNRVMSIVFDAFTFYTDFFLNKLIQNQAAAGKAPDNRAAYGSLGLHLREVRTSLHLKGTNVLWSCLAKHPETDDPKGRPLIPGQQSDKFAAGVDFLWHSRVEQKREGGKIVNTEYQLRTKQFGSYIAGNRLGVNADALPDPFVGTYADLITYLGYDVEAIRGAMPAIKPATAVAAKPTVVQPQGKTFVINRPGPKVNPPSGGNNQAPRGAVK